LFAVLQRLSSSSTFVLFLWMEDFDESGRGSRLPLEGEGSGMQGRLCLIRIVDRYSGRVPEQKPRDVSVLQDVLPDGSSFVACGFISRRGHGVLAADWVIWNVTVLCGSKLGHEEWLVYRAKVAEVLKIELGWSRPAFLRDWLTVVPNGEEAWDLAEDTLEAELREATKGAKESVWTGSFAKLRDRLSEE
jgi:hypothetical protein